MSKAQKLTALPRERKLILVEAMLYLFIARLIALVPLARWSQYLGELQGQTPEIDDDPQRMAQIYRIRWGIAAMSHHVPWRADCLPQAIAARLMLGRRGIANTLYLGVAKTKHEDQIELEAHAWLRSGRIIVTGAELAHRFRIISTFAKDYT